jgi:hypothetical protein
MLKTWNVLYQIGTYQAREAKCITDDETPATDDNFRRMLAIRNSVNPAEIRLIKISRAK